MSLFKSASFLCLLITLAACEKAAADRSDPEVKIIALTVADVHTAMDWYSKNLHFQRDTIMSFPDYGTTVGMMHQGDFYLELVSFTSALSKAQLDIPPQFSELNGFFKIGFQVSDIQALYEELLKTHSESIIAPLDKLPPIPDGQPWPEQYFLMEDPEGNYLQFFSLLPGQSEPATTLTPFLLASASDDIDRSIAWYETHLNARLIDKVGNEGNQRAILDRNGFIFELGQFDGYMPFDSLDISGQIGLSQVHGIRKISFLVPDIQYHYQHMNKAGIPMTFDLTEQKSITFDRFFMVADDTGNAIQFLEKDK